MRPFLLRPAVFFLLILVHGCGMGPSSPDAQLTAFDGGKTVKLSDLKGKVLVLDFWATWCSPCIETMPIIQQIYFDYVDKGVEVMGITNEERAKVKKFESENSFKYPIYLDGLNQATERFRISEIPRVVVIGKDGAIRYQGHPGDADRLRKEIEAAL